MIYQQKGGSLTKISLGGASADLLKRIENIESEIQSISAQLPLMLPSDHVTDNGSVTEPGWALDARQNNSSLDGSLANLIKRLETKAEYILRALSPSGYGSYNKTIKQVLEELIREENFSETRTRRWFINAKKEDRAVWYTCTATMAGNVPELNFSGMLIANWNEDSYVFYHYPKEGQWRFHKMADGSPVIEDI